MRGLDRVRSKQTDREGWAGSSLSAPSLSRSRRSVSSGCIELIFEEALRHGAWSIAIPPIGMGGHGFSVDVAMPNLARACAAAARMFDFDIRFVSTDRSHHRLFREEVAWSPR